ncbi:Protein phosphatase 2C 6 [Coemansia javaensis]|uniref:Protein phosphatase 2C 6 n=1 Tax=Coemansia javaensis TaxID=2761396 RepID=A0A9W8HCI5_9FUNG|nr:Protein phosphatase 2C 6 [Coemansia javaensis]
MSAAAATAAAVAPGGRRDGGAAPYYVAYTGGGTVRVDMRKSPQLVGQASSRGTRGCNQDRAEFAPLRIPGLAAARRGEGGAQIMYLGVYDGHGGDSCSEYLARLLHRYIETATAGDLQPTLDGMRQYGGDWAQYTPAALRSLEAAAQRGEAARALTVDERLTLAFVRADNDARSMRWSDGQGSTACVALLWDADGLPFWARDGRTNLVVASVGDCRAILCGADGSGGLAVPLNTPHHPGVCAERERLQRHGAFFSRDSFGEERAMARVAVTRAFGDWQVKRFGVFAEPEIHHRVLHGDEAAFLAIVSDGVTSVLTDQEIVDVVKGCATPQAAAKRLVDAAERLGSDDNMTAQVLRLPGWDRPLEDLTAEHRRRRLDSVERVQRLRGSMLVGPHGGSQSREEATAAAAAASGARLATPERLLRRIFTTHQRPQRRAERPPADRASRGPRLTVAQIQQRVRASGYRLTLVAEPGDLELGSDEDSGSVMSVPEVMRMTLSVLGIGGPSAASDRDRALTREQEDTPLSLQETDKAWRLIGLHVIEA